MMELIVADATGRDLRAIVDYDLDLAFGSDENDFELTCDARWAPPAGGYVYADGTEHGGTVDSVRAEASSYGERVLVCSGRTWHGVLAGKRLVPDAGQSHLRASGPAQAALRSLISRMGLGSLFSAPDDEGEGTVDYQFERFCDAYSGIRAMLAASGLKLTLRREGGLVVMGARPVTDWSSRVDSDQIDFAITRTPRRTNHLVCAGEGEMEGRAVLHLYADADGRVSTTQSLFGVDEIAALYDYSNADESKLLEDGTKRLSEMQGEGSIEIDVRDGLEMDVGDVVAGRDWQTGELVTAEVAKKVLTVTAGEPTVSYEVGSASTGTSGSSSSGSAESSGGGANYVAGRGIAIEGRTISAEVDSDDLGEVDRLAREAISTASAASSAASGRIRSVSGEGPVAAETDGGMNVTVSVAAATAGSAGLMGAADKAKLDGVEAGANRYVLPPASPGSLGGVSPDGETIVVDADGTAHAVVPAGAAAFLAAHPVGSVYETTSGTDPGDDFGGTWEEAPSVGAHKWIRRS